MKLGDLIWRGSFRKRSAAEVAIPPFEDMGNGRYRVPRNVELWISDDISGTDEYLQLGGGANIEVFHPVHGWTDVNAGRVTIHGEDGAAEIRMNSPDGTTYVLTVSDAGVLEVNPL